MRYHYQRNSDFVVRFFICFVGIIPTKHPTLYSNLDAANRYQLQEAGIMLYLLIEINEV